MAQGNRRDLKELGAGSQKVLNEVMYLIDLHDLYGYVAYPKAHSQSDISDIYRFAEVSNGIFVNPALQEPFGLTVIEVHPCLWPLASLIFGLWHPLSLAFGLPWRWPYWYRGASLVFAFPRLVLYCCVQFEQPFLIH